MGNSEMKEALGTQIAEIHFYFISQKASFQTQSITTQFVEKSLNCIVYSIIFNIYLLSVLFKE